ncbi:TonB-dependent receptor plug domain-containing protein [Vibrio algarum]|uniref:TonB-dependent receptor plug domain-containing protein n=1 Tax=Vibrio algarum TaxID=3020714 RepID=A0ABT4YMF8_9VIBR|nr:TonB-dependent receptor plug domain-containing protein [Vibrio sp. KJ40-1]MDB1122705.1 TonB-dependent receptor plug domain-containing protein [Vibrio sp. KJ40-1]
MNKSIIAAAVASLVSAPSLTFAQSSSDIETVVVTANRFEQPIQNTIAPVEVVTKEEIDAMQAKSMAEVLRRLPGIQISSNGGYGQSQSIYVRGSESNHVLVLVNGVRMGSATLGSSDLSAIPLTGIERIEYIRGSRAAVYGSDAVGGVINVITEYREGESLSEVSVGAGSDQYQVAKVSFAGEISNNLWGKFAGNIEQSDGFSSSSESTQSDDDGFKSKDIIAEIGGYVSTEWRLRANVFYHDGNVEFDYPETSEKDAVVSNYSASAEYLGDSLYSNLTAAFNSDKSETYNTGSDGVFQTDRTVLNWQNVYQHSEVYSFGGDRLVRK